MADDVGVVVEDHEIADFGVLVDLHGLHFVGFGLLGRHLLATARDGEDQQSGERKNNEQFLHDTASYSWDHKIWLTSHSLAFLRPGCFKMSDES